MLRFSRFIAKFCFSALGTGVLSRWVRAEDDRGRRLSLAGSGLDDDMFGGERVKSDTAVGIGHAGDAEQTCLRDLETP